MKFELKDSLRGASDDELLADLRRSAELIGRDTITMCQYEEVGRGHPCTINRRFGSWFKALELAGLRPSRSRIGIPEDELYENIRLTWVALGRQPKYAEMSSRPSKHGGKTYANRFGSWTKALKSFVEWVNTDEDGTASKVLARNASTTGTQPRRRSRREVSERQRFRILVRDGFRCQTCGATPLTKRGVELHIDHITPWSKGGETVDDNLQAKCVRCNLGKSNAFDV